MNESKDTIYTTAVNITIDCNNLTQTQMDDKYKEFKNNYSKIYQLCSSTSTQSQKQQILRELSLMLGVREEVKNGEKNSFVANAQIGEHVAQRYIYPKVGEPSLEDKKRAIAKMSKDTKLN